MLNESLVVTHPELFPRESATASQAQESASCEPPLQLCYVSHPELAIFSSDGFGVPVQVDIACSPFCGNAKPNRLQVASLYIYNADVEPATPCVYIISRSGHFLVGFSKSLWVTRMRRISHQDALHKLMTSSGVHRTCGEDSSVTLHSPPGAHEEDVWVNNSTRVTNHRPAKPCCVTCSLGLTDKPLCA